MQIILLQTLTHNAFKLTRFIYKVLGEMLYSVHQLSFRLNYHWGKNERAPPYDLAIRDGSCPKPTGEDTESIIARAAHYIYTMVPWTIDNNISMHGLTYRRTKFEPCSWQYSNSFFLVRTLSSLQNSKSQCICSVPYAYRGISLLHPFAY